MIPLRKTIQRAVCAGVLCETLFAPAHACTPIPLERLPPEQFFQGPDAAQVFLGTIVHIEEPSSSELRDLRANGLPREPVQAMTIDISETLKGESLKVMRIVRIDWQSMLMCGTEIFTVGDKVLVGKGDSANGGIVHLDPQSPYADRLRSVSRSLQSNPTVEPDARKNGARGSP